MKKHKVKRYACLLLVAMSLFVSAYECPKPKEDGGLITILICKETEGKMCP